MRQSRPPLTSITLQSLTWAITYKFINRQLNLCIKSRLPRISITQLNLTWCITWQCTESWFHASRVGPPLNWISQLTSPLNHHLSMHRKLILCVKSRLPWNSVKQLSLTWAITWLYTESWFHASKVDPFELNHAAPSCLEPPLVYAQKLQSMRQT